MAKLRSEEGHHPTYLELLPGEKTSVEGAGDEETWQEASITLVSGDYNISGGAAGDLKLCRFPKDEVSLLIQELDELLSGGRRRVMFEPSEPSFEINFERTSYGALRVDAWVDAGNAVTGFYIYDAVGIRFITSDDHLRNFTKQLAEEFGSVAAGASTK